MKPPVNMQIIETSFSGRPLNLVLWSGRRVVLVDTGLADTVEHAVLPALASLGRTAADIDLVIITHAHADHFAGNEGILNASRGTARFAAHHLDTAWIEDPPTHTRQAYGHFVELGLMTSTELDASVDASGNGVKVDVPLEGGEIFDLGNGLELEIHFTPGHTPGHICVLDRLNRVLVQGEAAAGVAQYDIHGRLLTAPYYEDLHVYLQSLEQIAQLEFDTFVPSHLPAMDRAATARFLCDSLEFALRFEAEVCDRLMSYRRPVTALELWHSLDNLWGQYPADLGLYMLLESHLTGMVRSGQATGTLRDGLVWTNCGDAAGEAVVARVRMAIASM